MAPSASRRFNPIVKALSVIRGPMTMKWLHCALGLVGMAVAALLFIAGITGAIQAFYNEIDKVLNPEFYRVETGGELLAPPALIEKLERSRPEIQVWYLQYPENPGDTAMLTAQPRPDAQGSYPEIRSDVFYLNPHTGEIVGEKYWGRCCFEADNLLNFLYEVHHSLKAGQWGGYLMGFAALGLLMNCLWVLLVAWKAGSGRDSAFLIPTRNRALAIVLALLLLPVAISSIAMNLPTEVFKPLVSLLSPVKPGIYEEYAEKDNSDFGSRSLSYNDAWRLAQDMGREKGWHGPVAELFYSSSYNFYGMAFGYRDPEGMGNNWIYLDGEDGHLVGSRLPMQGTSGDFFNAVQLPIHSGRIFGYPSKTLIAALGLLIAFLSARYLLITPRRLFRH